VLYFFFIFFFLQGAIVYFRGFSPRLLGLTAFGPVKAQLGTVDGRAHLLQDQMWKKEEEGDTAHPQ
jgi:hypothetical protein